MPFIIYSVTEARARIKELTGRSYSDQALRKAMRTGKLKYYKIGKLIVLIEQDIKEYVSKLRGGVKMQA